MKRYFMQILLITAVLILAANTLQARIVDRVVAKVNETIITLSDLKREAKVIRLEHPDKFGKMALDDPKALRFFLEQMISTILIEDELSKTGRGITDKEINAAYHSIMKKNKMTPKQFTKFLKDRGLTIQEYREALKARLERIRFFNTVIKSHIMISDEEVRAYYEKHKEDFNGVEKVRIAEIFVPVTPELNKDQRLKRQNLIMKIEAELYKGKSFQDILTAYAKNPLVRISGDLGWFKRQDLMKPIADAAFKLKKGAISEVIDTKSGFHIIKVLDIVREKSKNFQEVKDKIQKLLYQQESEKRLDEWLKKAREKANVQIML